MPHATINVGKLRVVEPRPTIRIARPEEEPEGDDLDAMERTIGAIEQVMQVIREAPRADPGPRKRGRPTANTERDLRAFFIRRGLEWTYRQIGRVLEMEMSDRAIGKACRSGERQWRNMPSAVTSRVEAKLNPNRPAPAEPDDDYRFDRGRW